MLLVQYPLITFYVRYVLLVYYCFYRLFVIVPHLPYFVGSIGKTHKIKYKPLISNIATTSYLLAYKCLKHAQFQSLLPIFHVHRSTIFVARDCLQAANVQIPKLPYPTSLQLRRQLTFGSKQQWKQDIDKHRVRFGEAGVDSIFSFTAVCLPQRAMQMFIGLTV